MQDIDKSKYFLIIPDIDLFPELQTIPVKMVEQIMNAYLLVNENNIQEGLRRVVEIDYFCNNLLKIDFLIALEKIKPIINKYGFEIVQGEKVRCMYPSFFNDSKYYDDVGKQSVMNINFAIQKKVSYNGKHIKFEDTYLNWVYKKINNEREIGKFNIKDKLVFNRIEPKATNCFLDTRKIILTETKKYVKEYQEQLKFSEFNKKY